MGSNAVGAISRALRSGKDEEGFSLVELMTVVIILGVMATIAVIVFTTSIGGTDAKGAREMIKEDLRRAYAYADDATAAANGAKVAYAVQFHGAGESPANCYRLVKGTPNVANPSSGTDYTWTPVAPDPNARLATTGNGWVKCSTQGGFSITYTNLTPSVNAGDGACNALVFVSRGSTLQKINAGPSEVNVTNGPATYAVTVSQFGAIGTSTE